MKKDWVVWLCCFLLFIAGALWAGWKPPVDFFKVTDIHDFFEICSSVATVFAVVLAALSVNTWRSQIGAQTDHDLARRLAVVALSYKDSCLVSWIDADFCFKNKDAKVSVWPDGLRTGVIEGLERKMEAGRKSRSELLALLLEVRAIWGVKKANEYDAVLNFSEQCHSVVRDFIVLNSGVGAEDYRQARYHEIADAEADFIGQGFVAGPIKVSERIALLAAEADKSLAMKLMRGS